MKLQPSRAHSVYPIHHTTMHQFTVPLHLKPCTIRVHVFSCDLPPALLAEWPGSFTCCCSNSWGWNEYQNKSAQKNWPWRRKFSHCSCGDSKLPQLFNNEPGALPTEQSLLPFVVVGKLLLLARLTGLKHVLRIKITFSHSISDFFKWFFKFNFVFFTWYWKKSSEKEWLLAF